MVFVKLTIFLKLERFKGKNFMSFPSLPFPPKETKVTSLPFLFPSFPFPPSPFLSFFFFLFEVFIQTKCYAIGLSQEQTMIGAVSSNELHG